MFMSNTNHSLCILTILCLRPSSCCFIEVELLQYILQISQNCRRSLAARRNWSTTTLLRADLGAVDCGFVSSIPDEGQLDAVLGLFVTLGSVIFL